MELSFTLNNLAQAYLKADGSASSERALELLSEALSIRKKKFGEYHELVGDTMFYVGRVYDLHSDGQAFQYFHEAKDIFEITVGKLHSKVAEVYDFLGSMYEARTEYENTCQHYEKSLSIKRASFGEDGMPVAETRDQFLDASPPHPLHQLLRYLPTYLLRKLPYPPTLQNRQDLRPFRCRRSVND